MYFYKKINLILNKLIIIKNNINKPDKLHNANIGLIILVVNRLILWVLFLIDRASSYFYILFFSIIRIIKKNETEKVDFVMCRYKYLCNSELESIEKITLEDTLRSNYPDKKILIFFWDINRPLFFFGINFIKTIAKANPKYLIFSSYSPDIYYHPMPFLLSRLKKRNISIISLWWDTCFYDFPISISSVLKTIDIHGIIDNPTMNFGDSKEALILKEKAINLFTPFELNDNNKKFDKDIDVVFLGQISRYRSSRRTFIEFLLDNNIRLHYSTYDKEHQCSNEKYYELLSRAKIGINFAMSVDFYQLIARVFEVMRSGALLLEERNAQTASYFNEDFEYVAFSSKEELLDKINFYLKNPNQRLRIAQAGYEKVIRKFTGTEFWNKLLPNEF